MFVFSVVKTILFLSLLHNLRSARLAKRRNMATARRLRGECNRSPKTITYKIYQGLMNHIISMQFVHMPAHVP
jgi:hypothetical protein